MIGIDIGCELVYDVRQSTVFLLKIRAAQTWQQQITAELTNVDPVVGIDNCQVGFECNQLQRLFVEPCQLRVVYSATVHLLHANNNNRMPCAAEADLQHLPADVLTYLYPSRYCLSDSLSQFALKEFGNVSRGVYRVQVICDWVANHLEYVPGSTTSYTTATDVLLQRAGVCRDYAHLAISFCRSLGIPARYVSAYAADLQPPDFHGLMEAFVGDQWLLFDPTGKSQTDRVVRIATGRDAADVAFATFCGEAWLQQSTVWATAHSNVGY